MGSIRETVPNELAGQHRSRMPMAIFVLVGISILAALLIIGNKMRSDSGTPSQNPALSEKERIVQKLNQSVAPSVSQAEKEAIVSRINSSVTSATETEKRAGIERLSSPIMVNY